MIKKITLFFCLCLMFFPFVGPVTEASANGQPFSVRAILPVNQDKNITNYISITTNKKEISQEIQFIVTNKTNKPLKIKVHPVNALTSPNGVIQYLPTLKETNSEIINNQYGLEQFIKGENTLELKPSENKVVKLNVDIPEMNGTVLGGVGFQTIKESKEDTESQFSITNEINNIIGVQFNFPTKEKPNFIIGEPFIDSMPSLYALRLPITNNSPLLLKETSLDYEVWDYKGEKVFGSDKIDFLFNFAPNTKANIAIPWDNEVLSEGKTYKITGQVKYQDKSYPFEKEFTFKNDGDKYSSVDNIVPVIGENWNWLVVAICILLGLILFILWKRRKYVLPSTNAECKEEIYSNEDKELFIKVIPYRKLKDYEDDYSYLHFYRKIKKKQELGTSKVEMYKYQKTVRKDKNK
ncbi:WxL protein peptidoglycan domain-containing protein [Cytobacillus horneckiae]|uniref:WxL protein peptidoglycan domain-containing protein n=1 Tax=Cytobacillus horneckiae TaxID=549687 RepID=UPI003D209D3D